MATTYPEPIDEDGNIWVHADGSFPGAALSIRDNGKITDISGSPLFFEVARAVPPLRVALSANPSDPKARRLPALSKLQCATIPLTGASWVLWDETGGARIDLFGGQIRRYGQ